MRLNRLVFKLKQKYEGYRGIIIFGTSSDIPFPMEIVFTPKRLSISKEYKPLLDFYSSEEWEVKRHRCIEDEKRKYVEIYIEIGKPKYIPGRRYIRLVKRQRQVEGHGITT